MWFTLKKSTGTIYVTYGHCDATLFVENVAIRPGDPFDVSIDMGKNLRTRNKGENTYVDAQDLSEQMDSLKSVHINDDTVINGIAKQLERMKKSKSHPKRARLRLMLNGEHWFFVGMQSGDYGLTLTIQSATEED